MKSYFLKEHIHLSKKVIEPFWFSKVYNMTPDFIALFESNSLPKLLGKSLAHLIDVPNQTVYNIFIETIEYTRNETLILSHLFMNQILQSPFIKNLELDNLTLYLNGLPLNSTNVHFGQSNIIHMVFDKQLINSFLSDESFIEFIQKYFIDFKNSNSNIKENLSLHEGLLI